jgi:methylenetetrahydrofolate reductase (NADPH)
LREAAPYAVGVARIADLLAAGRTYSFEFSPPGTEAGWMTLGRTIAELDYLNPSFVSVTYGAGGGTRVRTHEAVAWIRKETPVTPMAHLTCVSHTRAQIGEILDSYDAVGVENILALAGDPVQAGPKLKSPGAAVSRVLF